MQQGFVVFEKSRSTRVFGRQREKVVLLVRAGYNSNLRHVNNLLICFESVAHHCAVLVQLLEPGLLNKSFDPHLAFVELGVCFTGISVLRALVDVQWVIIFVIQLLGCGDRLRNSIIVEALDFAAFVLT